MAGKPGVDGARPRETTAVSETQAGLEQAKNAGEQAALLTAWSALAPAEAARYAFAHLRGQRRLLQSCFIAWLVHDEAGAETFLRAAPLDPETLSAGVETLLLWRIRDTPAAKIDWVTRLPVGPFRDATKQTVLSLAHATDTTATIKWVHAFGNDPDHPAMVAALAGVWAKRAPAETCQWAASLERPESKTAALVAALPSLVAQNPLDAAEFFLTHDVSTDALDPAMQTFLRNLRQTRPELAAIWINNLEGAP